MKKEVKNIGLIDPETGDTYTLENVTGELFEDGENWNVKFSATTTKTQFLLFELARLLATGNEGGQMATDARRILQTIYKKLEVFTVETKEDGTGILCHWKARAGTMAATVDKEMREIMEMPLFKHALKHVFGIAKKPDEIETTTGGAGVRVAAEWTKARFAPEKQSGRKTSAEEKKLEFCLMKLLRDYSTHRDREHPLYLLGNGGENRIEAEGVLTGPNGRKPLENEQMLYAVLSVQKKELYKEYTGKKSVLISSAERVRVNALLDTMAGDILPAWSFKKGNPDGTVKWVRVGRRQKIEVLEGADNLTKSESDAIERGEEPAQTQLLIKFHPAFTYEIGQKYSSFPEDYLERMKQATGGGRSSERGWLLNDYLNGIRCTGTKETEADFDTLIEKMDLTRFAKKQGKGKTVSEIEEAANVAKKVGLVSSFERSTGKKGQLKFTFKFNPDFGGAIHEKYRTIGGK